MSHIPTLIIFLVFIILSSVPDAQATPERRIALVIGNGSYAEGPLLNPANDAGDMANALKSLGFEVILKKNVRHQEMEESVESFGKLLRRGGVGLFYYAGHGVQVGGVNYLLPIGARINKESDVKHQAVSAEKVLDEMAEANNGLNIVLLDACRDNPFARSMRSAGRGLAIISSAPEGTFISYATGTGQTARDGDGRNSPYTAALLKNMKKPGLPIERVFKLVRVELSHLNQTPWELSSLKGEFYFQPGNGTAEAFLGETEAALSGQEGRDYAMVRPSSVSKESDTLTSFTQIGVTLQAITPEMARNLCTSEEGCIKIVQVNPGSPADASGLKPGDIILKINSQRTRVINDFKDELARNVEGNETLMLIRRGKAQYFVKVHY